MRKMLGLLLLCFFVYLPSVSAELYQNRDYNFQIELPDGWISDGKSQALVNRKIQINENDTVIAAGFALKVDYLEGKALNIAISRATPKQKKYILDGIRESMIKQYPGIEITYSNSMYLGENEMLVVRGKFKDSPVRLIVASALMRGNTYNFMFASNSPTAQYEPQFFDMLKTLRLMEGRDTHDGIYEEEVKYKRDIAERDAIDSLTGKGVTVQ